MKCHFQSDSLLCYLAMLLVCCLYELRTKFRYLVSGQNVQYNYFLMVVLEIIQSWIIIFPGFVRFHHTFNFTYLFHDCVSHKA